MFLKNSVNKTPMLVFVDVVNDCRIGCNYSDAFRINVEYFNTSITDKRKSSFVGVVSIQKERMFLYVYVGISLLCWTVKMKPL